MGVKQPEREDLAVKRYKDDAIVISGMAGKFPEADSVQQFSENLFNKVAMVTFDNRRWTDYNTEIPHGIGKISGVDKFDMGFFGYDSKAANKLEPPLRIAIEQAFQTVLDAGYNPEELRGTNTGVFVGVCVLESALTYHRAQVSRTIGYALQLNGPNHVCDTACSSSAYALDIAYKAMSNGLCDRALVVGINMCLFANTSLQFVRLGVLSKDCRCKSFDDAADGYARSEGIACVLLEKYKTARRMYAEVIYSKTNVDGYKPEGITFPSSETQTELLRDFYNDCKVDPTTLSFVEAHGTGTKVGDPEEMITLDTIFCTGRERPLYIGSVKSNLGHQEPASGVTALIKVLIGMETGYIPPNINFSKPRRDVPALVDGRIKVVTEAMSWPDNNGLAAINNFGFGGANAHLLIRWNKKVKVNGSLPKDNLPRLVCLSGRTESSVSSFIDDLVTRPLDVEYISLLHEIFKIKIDGYNHRGYVVKEKYGFVVASSAKVEQKRRVCFVFSKPDKYWFELGRELVSFKIFSEAVERIRSTINNEINFEITDVVNTKSTLDVQEVLGTIVFQIAIGEVLAQLGIEPDATVGIGLGTLVAAYFDGFLTLRETVTLAFYFAVDQNKFRVSLKKITANKQIQSKLWRSVNVTDNNHNDFNYFQTNLSNPVSAKEIENTIGIETILGVIGPSVNLESALTLSIVPSSSRKVSRDFLMSLGWLHQKGFDVKLNLLYPEVSYPVSRGTPMISHHLRWLHETPCEIHLFRDLGINGSHQFVEGVTSKLPFWSFLSGHVIDGRNLFPATGYLFLVWRHFLSMIGRRMEESRILFRDVKFIKAANIEKENLTFWMGIEANTHRFEISESGELLVHGFIEQAPEDESIADFPVPEYFSAEAILEERDIYKELRLRGYNYKEAFRSLKKSRVDGIRGTILWNCNWITFTDNMLQMMLLQEDTKNLYIPTGIQRLVIDSKLHMSKCEYYKNNMPVISPKGLNLIISGGIQVRGLSVSTIPRRRTPDPVLEYSKFVPNEGTQSARDAIRCFIQLILENTRTSKFKSVEVAQDEELITPLVQASLGDLPLIKPELVIFTKTTVELANVRVESGDSIAESDCILVIVSGASQNQEMMDKALQATKQINGYILTREDLEINRQTLTSTEVAVMCEIKTNKETLILLRRTSKSQERSYLNLTNSLHNTDWISTLQEMMKINQNVVLYAENSNCNGILGLVNCLRQEFPDDRITCVFLMDEAPKFNPNDDFYKTQLNKSMAVNIWKDKQWGTYRHLELVPNQTVESEHCFAKALSPGDLSSIRWIENSLSTGCYAEPEKELVHIYYCALNFRDVMTASGKISPDVITKDRILQECCQGFEFSGRTSSGRRIMGTINSGALSSLIMADSHTTLPVPDEWSLEDAATVIVVYTTVFFAFFQRSNLQRGQSILIHSGTGGVGQAAINVATHYGCTIFTTVGTPEKKEFIRKHFPQIKDEHIGDSRSTSFEEMIRYHTDGRGVDVVLNSLAEDKLQASMRCLARKGTFLEIGKFDMAQNNHIAMNLLNKEALFAGVMLDQIFSANNEIKARLFRYCTEGIEKGYVKPLMRTTFKSDEIETAFRYMAAGKHMGKVLIKMRDEEDEKIVLPTVRMFRGIPRFSCKAGCTYVVVGGLGGFGLELADWLVTRGAKKLVLTSRTGVKSGYQNLRLSVFKSYGVKTIIRKDDVSTEKGCAELLTAAEEVGPIDAIFNLAVILQDGLFENQTPETFKTSLAPKAHATKNLDVISRKTSTSLRYFVIFSSVSCGRGNAGQTNYGMANSVMERICEQRKRDGYPALAIQWGAIGDVGLVAEMQERDTEMVIGGTLQQRIRSCLKVLDDFLRQDEPIVSSMVVAEKKSSLSSGSPMNTVLHVLGISNINSISVHTPFPELGMDSIMAVELKQILETDYDIVLGAQDLRSLTLAKLKEMTDDKVNPDKEAIVATEEHFDLNLLMKNAGDEATAYLPLVKLQTNISNKDEAPNVFCLPGIEGAAFIYHDLAKKLNFHLTCLQFLPDRVFESIEEHAESLLPAIESTSGDFIILAYSFGCGVAVEMVHRLEKKGRRGRVVFIDGSPEFIKRFTRKLFPIDDVDHLQTTILFWLISRYLNPSALQFIVREQQNVMKIPTLEGKIKACLELEHLPETNYSDAYMTDVTISGYHRIQALQKYIPPAGKLRSDAVLCKPEQLTLADLEGNYGLSNIFAKPVPVKNFTGNHLSILKEDQLAATINKYVLSGTI